MGGHKELNFDVRQVRSFVEVLRQRSFTRASRRLRVGQGTISMHISSLEKTLGVSLIRRTSRDFEVTREGEVFGRFCTAFLNELEGMGRELGQESIEGTTTVAASTIPSAYILPTAMRAVMDRHPGHRYRVEVFDSREVIESVKEGQAELGVAGKMTRHPALIYRNIHRDEIALIAPVRGYPDTVLLGDLPGLPFVTREKGSGTRDATERALKEHRITPSKLRAVMECSSSEAVREAVAAGLGVAFLSLLVVRNEAGSGRIKVVKVPGLRIERNFHLVYKKGGALSASAKLLASALSGKRPPAPL